jgi:hypothetical protein
MTFDKALIIPPAEYLPWVKQLVADLNEDEVGGGVEHVRKLDWVGIFALPDDFFVRFKDGSDGHSAKLLRQILDKGYNPFYMRYMLWPALLAQGRDGSKEND